METTLSSALNNEYCELTNIITANPNRIDVLVEDELDVPFWYEILHTEIPTADIRVTPYQYGENDDSDLTKGKQHILQESLDNKFGKYYIGCVDSDYDYIMQSISENWTSMSTPYVFQTYAYSIENLLIHPNTLLGVCYDSTCEYIEYDFEDLFKRLSQTLYPLLIWALYIQKIGSSEFTKKSWNRVFPSTLSKESSLRIDDLINEVKKLVEAEILKLETIYPNATEDLRICEQDFLMKHNVNKENCYLYVRGHNLYKFILARIMKPLTDSARKKHYQILQKDSHETKQLANHYKQILIDIDKSLARNYGFKHDDNQYAKIKSDIVAFLST